MKPGIVICSRKQSSRIKEKPFQKVNGVPLIVHLGRRCMKTGVETIISVPKTQFELYDKEFPRLSDPKIDGDSQHLENPLKRMYETACKYKLDPVIRVCHDKIFIDEDEVQRALKYYQSSDCDYLYSSDFVDGAGFEIISFKALKEAVTSHFENVEHISYAIKNVTKKIYHYKPLITSRHRLLVDYPEDLDKLEMILSTLGNDCLLQQAIFYCDSLHFSDNVNSLPLVTVYTCAYNAKKWLGRCVHSVGDQKRTNFEYIVIDDFSSDETFEELMRLKWHYPSMKVVRNQENIGLASSSNKALSMAKGKYIIRLDADDYFTEKDAIKTMVNSIEDNDVIYPSFYHGSRDIVGNPKENHHVGGALFLRRAINHIKFTSGLRGYDSLDVWYRARNQLNITYHDKPLFFYTQHDKSLSKTNLEARRKIKEDLDAHYQP